jgi:hypothetical protein
LLIAPYSLALQGKHKMASLGKGFSDLSSLASFRYILRNGHCTTIIDAKTRKTLQDFSQIAQNAAETAVLEQSADCRNENKRKRCEKPGASTDCLPVGRAKI